MLTPSEIEAMAYEAGDDGGDFHVDRAWLTRFATLVAAKARAEAMEEAVKIMEAEAVHAVPGSGGWHYNNAIADCAAAIRAAQKEAS